LQRYQEGLGVAREHGLMPVKSALYSNLSSCFVALGRLDEAVSAGEESVAIKVQNGFRYGLAGPLNNLAVAACLGGDLTLAASRIGEALSTSRSLGDHRIEREALAVQSEIELRQGMVADATRSVEEALDLIRARGDRYLEAPALRQRAKLLAAMGRWEEAERVRAQAATAYQHAKSRPDSALEILLAQTEPDWAARQTRIPIRPAGSTRSPASTAAQVA
jgi:tetratricopeptide (TPR) repeat protein